MRVLLLGYETECCSMAYLAELLQENGHEALLAQCDYYNFIDSDGIHNFFRSRGFTDWVNYEEEYRKLYESDMDIDWEYLAEFESKFTDSKNLHQLLMTDPILRRDHHFRNPYYTPIESKELVYYWAETLIRWIRGVIDDLQPDVVFTYGRNYFVKNVVAQLSATTELSMLTLLNSRIRGFCHVSHEFGLGTDDRIAQRLRSDEYWPDVSEAQSHIKQFREQPGGGLYEEPAQRRMAEDTLYDVSEILGEWASSFVSLNWKILRRAKRRYRGTIFARNHFNSHFPSVLRNETRIAFNRLRYRFTDPFRRELPDKPFIYVPLHMLPESSTLTLSTEYYERDILRYMSKELPVGLDIAVKENPNMVGIRPFGFYDDLKSLPNVRLVDPMVQSKRLIREARGVSAISGTALLEATMLDTPTHHFGCPEFEAVLDYKGREEFPAFVTACTDGAGSRHPYLVERYVQYVVDEGRKVPYKEIRFSPRTEEWREGTDIVHEMFVQELETVEI